MLPTLASDCKDPNLVACFDEQNTKNLIQNLASMHLYMEEAWIRCGKTK